MQLYIMERLAKEMIKTIPFLRVCLGERQLEKFLRTPPAQLEERYAAGLGALLELRFLRAGGRLHAAFGAVGIVRTDIMVLYLLVFCQEYLIMNKGGPQ